MAMFQDLKGGVLMCKNPSWDFPWVQDMHSRVIGVPDHLWCRTDKGSFSEKIQKLSQAHLCPARSQWVFVCLSIAYSNLREILCETFIPISKLSNHRLSNPLKLTLHGQSVGACSYNRVHCWEVWKQNLCRKRQMVVFFRDFATTNSTTYFANDTTLTYLSFASLF